MRFVIHRKEGCYAHRNAMHAVRQTYTQSLIRSHDTDHDSITSISKSHNEVVDVVPDIDTWIDPANFD